MCHGQGTVSEGTMDLNTASENTSTSPDVIHPNVKMARIGKPVIYDEKIKFFVPDSNVFINIFDNRERHEDLRAFFTNLMREGRLQIPKTTAVACANKALRSIPKEKMKEHVDRWNSIWEPYKPYVTIPKNAWQDPYVRRMMDAAHNAAVGRLDMDWLKAKDVHLRGKAGAMKIPLGNNPRDRLNLLYSLAEDDRKIMARVGHLAKSLESDLVAILISDDADMTHFWCDLWQATDGKLMVWSIDEALEYAPWPSDHA